MGILTSIPFGLAIRDTLGGTTTRQLGEAEPDPEVRAEQAASEIREEAASRDRETRHLEQQELLRQLYRNGTVIVRPRFNERGIYVQYEGMLPHIEITDKLLCEELDRELVDEWGPGVPNEGRVWLDPPGFAGERARLYEGGCKLDYDHYTPADAAVTTGPESIVPIAAIGTDAKAFRDRIGKQDMFMRSLQDGTAADGDFVSWTAPGIGAGVGRIALKASQKHGKISNLFASGTSDDATLDELESALDESFGPSTLDARDTRRWHGVVPIALLRTPVGYTLFVGHADVAR
jgi:hypothetical protein